MLVRSLVRFVVLSMESESACQSVDHDRKLVLNAVAVLVKRTGQAVRRLWHRIPVNSGKHDRLGGNNKTSEEFHLFVLVSKSEIEILGKLVDPRHYIEQNVTYDDSK